MSMSLWIGFPALTLWKDDAIAEGKKVLQRETAAVHAMFSGLHTRQGDSKEGDDRCDLHRDCECFVALQSMSSALCALYIPIR